MPVPRAKFRDEEKQVLKITHMTEEAEGSSVTNSTHLCQVREGVRQKEDWRQVGILEEQRVPPSYHCWYRYRECVPPTSNIWLRYKIYAYIWKREAAM